jgi:hypothetical protein
MWKLAYDDEKLYMRVWGGELIYERHIYYRTVARNLSKSGRSWQIQEGDKKFISPLIA